MEEQYKDDFYNSLYVFQTRFDIPKNYCLEKPIGTGGFGVVLRASSLETGETLAIKKIIKPFINLLETKRILREIKILRAFKHDNIIGLRDILNLCPRENFNEIYLVCESMESDLHQIISSDQPLTEDHIQFFMYQLLCGVKYLHSANIFHRDLKPSNLLVNSDCQLKICDFGLARAAKFNDNNLTIMTEYVATRWYRAPELLLSWKEYTTAVDMWSIGCILGELLLRKPLLPGESLLNQLNLIIHLCGTPNEEDLADIQSARAANYIKSKTNYPGLDFAAAFPDTNPLIVDLLRKLLVFNPAKRLTANQALDHPFFESIRERECEVEPGFQFNFDFDEKNLSIEEVKDEIYEEMRVIHSKTKKGVHFPEPTIPDEMLYTLDVDGSLIYIDYSKQKSKLSLDNNNINNSLLSQNNEQEILGFLGYKNMEIEEEKEK